MRPTSGSATHAEQHPAGSSPGTVLTILPLGKQVPFSRLGHPGPAAGADAKVAVATPARTAGIAIIVSFFFSQQQQSNIF